MVGQNVFDACFLISLKGYCVTFMVLIQGYSRLKIRVRCKHIFLFINGVHGSVIFKRGWLDKM